MEILEFAKQPESLKGYNLVMTDYGLCCLDQPNLNHDTMTILYKFIMNDKDEIILDINEKHEYIVKEYKCIVHRKTEEQFFIRFELI